MTSSISQACLGSLAPPQMAGRYQGLHGVAYTTGTGAGPLIGGAVYAIGPWALWALWSVQEGAPVRTSTLPVSSE